MNAPSPITIRVQRRIEASAERVFDVWLDPALARQFLFATPDGEMRTVEIDARVGGTFRIVERRNDEDAEHFGVWLEIERPHRLVFAFSLEKADPDADRVSIDIVADGDACTVTLTHEMNPRWADYTERTESGWSGILAGLDRALAA